MNIIILVEDMVEDKVIAFFRNLEESANFHPHANEASRPLKPKEIGINRTYETMVFNIGGECRWGCGLPMPENPEIILRGYNSAKRGDKKSHVETCNQVAAGDF